MGYHTIKSICIAGVAALSLTFSASSLATDSLAISKHGKFPTYPKIDYGKGKKAELIKKGEYLAKAGDCIACHTAPGGTPFAGGLSIDTPFGTIYTPNITSDKKHGIGSWTDKEFIHAMKDGVNPKGEYYYPAFPYVFFNKLTDADVLAIKAYLEALPPSAEENKQDKMKFPFNHRFLLFGWRMMFFDFDKGDFKPNPKQSKEWNRGAYLVEGLGHCSMCHTELNFLGSPKKKYYLAGAFIEGFHAPNITSANLGDISVLKIADVFKQDRLVRGGNVAGPMLEVNHDSLKYLSLKDLESIATYLKTVKSDTPPAPKVAGSGLKAGKAVYEQYCVGCHGTGAGGAPKIGDAAEWAPKIALGIDKLHANALHGIGGMPPKGTCSVCTDKQIYNAVDYMVAESRGKAGEKFAAPKKAYAPDTSVAHGKVIYKQACAVCHTDGKFGAPKIGDKAAWAPLIKQNLDVLFARAIAHYKGIPYQGKQFDISNSDIEAAVKYIVNQSKTGGDYKLW